MLGLWQAERTYPEVLNVQLQPRVVTPSDLKKNKIKIKLKIRTSLQISSFFIVDNKCTFFPKFFWPNKPSQLATDIT